MLETCKNQYAFSCHEPWGPGCSAIDDMNHCHIVNVKHNFGVWKFMLPQVNSYLDRKKLQECHVPSNVSGKPRIGPLSTGPFTLKNKPKPPKSPPPLSLYSWSMLLFTHVLSVITKIPLTDWRKVSQTWRSAFISNVTRVWWCGLRRPIVGLSNVDRKFYLGLLLCRQNLNYPIRIGAAGAYLFLKS